MPYSCSSQLNIRVSHKSALVGASPLCPGRTFVEPFPSPTYWSFSGYQRYYDSIGLPVDHWLTLSFRSCSPTASCAESTGSQLFRQRISSSTSMCSLTPEEPFQPHQCGIRVLPATRGTVSASPIIVFRGSMYTSVAPWSKSTGCPAPPLLRTAAVVISATATTGRAAFPHPAPRGSVGLHRPFSQCHVPVHLS